MNYEQRVRGIVRLALNGSERGKDWSVAGEDEATQAIISLIREAKIEELQGITGFFVRPFEAEPYIEKLLKALDYRITELKAEAEL